MESLVNLQTQQIFAFGIVAAVLILLIAHYSRKGLFSFKGKGFSVGQDTERLILRQQLQYVDAAVEEAMTEIEKKDTWNNWKAKYTSELVKDCLQKMVSFNHLSMDKSYVLVKQLEVWACIQKNEMVDPYYSSEEFKQIIYRWVEDAIKDLLDIRKFYESK